MTTSPQAPALVAELHEELRTTARMDCAALTELEPIAMRLADLEERLCAARHQAGIHHDVRPPARELAAEILHGAVQALSLYVRASSRETAQPPRKRS